MPMTPEPEQAEREAADIMIGEFIARWDDAADGVTMDADTAQALAREFKRMRGLIYCPGVLCCAKCGFRLTKTVLTPDGAFCDESPDTCPNCNVPMWKITWSDEAHQAYKVAESQMDRAIEAEKALAAQSAEIERLKAEVVKADHARTCYARALEKMRIALVNINDGLEDEGDRIYLGSTNHADDIRAAWQIADALRWDELLEHTQPQTPIADTNLKLQATIANLRKDLAEALEVLKPFADMAGPINSEDGRISCIEAIEGENGTGELYLGTHFGTSTYWTMWKDDFTKARALIQRHKGDGK